MIDYLVCYADTDAGGVLHHARYLELAERGYHGWLMHRGLSSRALGREHALSLAVVDLSARYKSAVFLEDQVRVDTRLHALDRTGLAWRTRILKDGAVAFSLATRMVCLSASTRTIISVPAFLLARLAADVGAPMFADGS